MDFRTFTGTIVGSWKLVIGALLACLVGAGFLTTMQTKSYQSSATILISFSGAQNLTDIYYATQAAQDRFLAGMDDESLDLEALVLVQHVVGAPGAVVVLGRHAEPRFGPDGNPRATPARIPAPSVGRHPARAQAGCLPSVTR